MTNRAHTAATVLAAQDYGPYAIHPLLACFPMMSIAQFAALVEDISTHGLSNSIMLSSDESTIVDGRLRYLACYAALVDPHFRKLPASFTEEQIGDYIWSENVLRQHLTPKEIQSASDALGVEVPRVDLPALRHDFSEKLVEARKEWRMSESARRAEIESEAALAKRVIGLVDAELK